MVGLLLLQQIDNWSDEKIIKKWVQNPYYQAFCGKERFQWDVPCELAELAYFRECIGADGMKKIIEEFMILGKP